MKTLQEVLNLSIDFLTQRGIGNPRRSAEEIISDALGIKRLQLYMEFDRPLNETEVEKCRLALSRRAKREPPQYIKGSVDFLDCLIKVTPDVLIPRNETEILTDKIIKTLEKENLEGKVLWDICCGSGCIGLALKKRFPELQVILSDLSPKALAIAKENAIKNNLEVTFLEGNLLAPFKGMKAHYVVSNPPYICETEYEFLEPEVKDYEPKQALVAEEKGLSFYKQFAAELPLYLHPQAKVWFELGSQQGSSVKSFFSHSIWHNITLESDFAGHDRFFFISNNEMRTDQVKP